MAGSGACNRVKRLDVQQWAEPLEKGISRVLAENLSQLLGTRGVIVYPDQANATSGYAIQYTVSRFEGGFGDTKCFEQEETEETEVQTECPGSILVPNWKSAPDVEGAR